MDIKKLALLTIAVAAPAAWAHGQGVHTHDAGLIAGMLHPFSGLDHLLAMVAVGLWAAQQGGRALWVLPLSFVSAMAVGAMLGMSGVAFAGMEAGIALSVLALGALVVLRRHMLLPLAVMLTGGFALFHGVAHGQEMPLAASPWGYGFGMLAATILLHGAGVLAGCKLRQLYLGMAGAAISLAGLGMLANFAG
ncbi:HupE/UreJ family protein [Betaproteobacteria bacterium SCN2]|jgi:urease accessory protein|nr:HupE/UreJ family protein [Betaproteobacteria bacterium SCN2]